MTDPTTVHYFRWDQCDNQVNNEIFFFSVCSVFLMLNKKINVSLSPADIRPKNSVCVCAHSSAFCVLLQRQERESGQETQTALLLLLPSPTEFQT